MTNRVPITRWTSWFLTAVLFSIACWFLSQWQFARQEEVVRANNLIAQNFDLSPVPLDQVLQPEALWKEDLEYRPVRITGNYLPESTLLVRNRPYDGQPGFLQLVAFQINDGSKIWVERGWLPTGENQDSPDVIPTVDNKEHSVVIRLRASEPNDSRQAPIGQIPNLDIKRASLLFSFSDVYRQSYGRLVSESPALDRGIDLGRPQLSEGNHLSYAMQWIIFGLMAFGAVFWNISQDRRRIQGREPLKLASLNRDRDAEIEDQLLEK